MAVTTQIICNQVLNNSGITGNGVFALFTSSTINNSVGLPCGRLVLDYSSVDPLDTGTNPISYGISVSLEGQIDGVWYPVCYQFEAYRGNPANGNQRVVVVQPGIQSFDAGIDDIVWMDDTTTARISRQQGRIGPTVRLAVRCKENGFGTAGAFQSVHLRALLELYDEAG